MDPSDREGGVSAPTAMRPNSPRDAIFGVSAGVVSGFLADGRSLVVLAPARHGTAVVALEGPSGRLAGPPGPPILPRPDGARYSLVVAAPAPGSRSGVAGGSPIRFDLGPQRPRPPWARLRAVFGLEDDRLQDLRRLLAIVRRLILPAAMRQRSPKWDGLVREAGEPDPTCWLAAIPDARLLDVLLRSVR